MNALFPLLWLLSLPCIAANPQTVYSRAVSFSEPGQPQLLAIQLDNAIYAHSAADFRDLRLLDQNGVETPYLLQKVASRQTVTQRIASPSEPAKLEKSGDQGIVLTVALSRDAQPADGFSLITGQRDFEYDLAVQGSNDGQIWQTVLEHAAIFDYSRYMQFANHDVSLPGNSYRWFKIRIAQAAQSRATDILQLTRTLQGEQEQQRSEAVQVIREPLHIERIEFWHQHSETQVQAEQSFEYPLTDYQIIEDREHKLSLVDIHAQRQPLTAIQLKAITPLYSRRAELQIQQSTGLDKRMQTLASAALESVKFRDFQREQNRIQFPMQRQTHYRLVIANQDNPPLQISDLTGSGPGYQVLFLPQPGSQYELRYGDESQQFPRYDTAPLQELQRHGYAYVLAQLAAETPPARYENNMDWRVLLNSRLFLTGAILVMVLVLGWSLYRVINRL